MHRSTSLAALFVMLGVVLAFSTAALAKDEEPPPTRVKVTVDLPAKLPSFDNAAVVAILFEYDPLLADVGATEIERIVIQNLGHQKGVEQSLRFYIGDKLGAVKPERRYYISCRIYEDLGKDGFKQGKQIHYCHNEHDRLPGTVYDKPDVSELIFTAR